jgi:hypothetical protein
MVALAVSALRVARSSSPQFEIILQNDYSRDRIDGLLLFAARDKIPEAFFRFEAGKPLILKLYLDIQCFSQFSREISRVSRHRTFGSIHVDGKPHNKAVYLTAPECLSDSLQIGAESASFDGA